MSNAAWDGAVNLADLGGIPAPGGRTAKGRVFRSAASEYLTDQGWVDAKAAGVTTVIDLRNADERGRRPEHPLVSDTATDGLVVVHVPIDAPDDPEFVRLCGPWLDHPRYYPDNLALCPSRFAAVFETTADADGAVLVHCAGGRDRTGLIVAMLLRLAGIEPGEIGRDYELAARRIEPYQRQMATDAGARLETSDEFDAKVLERRRWLEDWIGTFDVASYLRGSGLSAEQVDQLKVRLFG